MTKTRWTVEEWTNIDMSAAASKVDSGVSRSALHRLNVELLTRHNVIDAAERAALLGETGFRHPDGASKMVTANIDPVEVMVWRNKLRRKLESAGALPRLLTKV